LYLERFQ